MKKKMEEVRREGRKVEEYKRQMRELGLEERVVRQVDETFCIGELLGETDRLLRWRETVESAVDIEMGLGKGSVETLGRELGWSHFERYSPGMAKMAKDFLERPKEGRRKYLLAGSREDKNGCLARSLRMELLMRQLAERGVELEVREFESGKELADFVDGRGGENWERVLILAHGESGKGISWSKGFMSGKELAEMIRQASCRSETFRGAAIVSCFGGEIAKDCRNIGSKGERVEIVGPMGRFRLWRATVSSEGEIDWSFYGRKEDGRWGEVPKVRFRV